MSNVAGKVLIDELLEDTKAALGDHFDLRAFHDEFLGHGTIPIELIRMEMRIPAAGSVRVARPGDKRLAFAAILLAKAKSLGGQDD